MIWAVNTPRLYRGIQPERSPRYRAFVRKLRCAGCGKRYGIDAAHTGPHGVSQKADDRTCIPLCREKCHRAYDRDPKAFAEKRHMDVPGLIRQTQRAWCAEESRRKIA